MIPPSYVKNWLAAEASGRRWALALLAAPAGEHLGGEIVAEGYPAGGADLTGARVEQDGRRLYLAWDTPTVFPSSTISARYAAIYDRTSGAVAVALDFGETVTSKNGPFTVTVPRDAFAVRV